jgi:large repetitive protein
MHKTIRFVVVLMVLALLVVVGNNDSSVSAQQVISFSASSLGGTTIDNPTTLQFGPDGRLYVAQQNGVIHAYTISRSSANNYQVVATEVINLIKNMQNYNDDGSTNSTKERQITGILVTGTAAVPVLYVTSSDWRISVGFDSNLDTNSGIISRLTRNGSSWTKVDLVRGLPRNEENHSTNGMVLNAATNTLYVAQGGNTNMGAPSNSFANQPEYALSAAILSVNLSQIGNTTYDIPTLDDPSRSNSSSGVDVNDPFGGNNGANQARIVVGGPVQIYSPGYRNVYDLIITAAGRMYTIDNGPNAGWGGPPINEGPGGNCTNGINENGSNSYPDGLHYVTGLGYYGGHPAPVRGNPDSIFSSESNSPVPFSLTNAVECDYRSPSLPANQGGAGALTTFSSSTNGFTEYTASNFGGAMQGNLLAASFDNSIYRVILNSAGTSVTSKTAFFTNFAITPLDVIAQGNGQIFPGTIWSANYSSDNITVFEPADYNGGSFQCTGANNASIDEDNDGYDNADEIVSGTNPCSGGSIPPDFDNDYTSDRTDTDDDNDSLLDTADAFARDATNGANTNLPIRSELFNNDPGTGFFGVGFTGLMIRPSSQSGVDYLDQYVPNNMTVGGAAGRFTIDSTPSSTAQGSTNNQLYAFQRGFNVTSSTGLFTVHSRIASPYFSNNPQGNQSLGMFIGNGNQDNFLEIALVASNAIRVTIETNGSTTSNVYNVSGILSSTSIDLYLDVNPSTGAVQPRYAINNGAAIAVGPSITIPSGSPLMQTLTGTPTTAFGFIASAGTAAPFTATWEFYDIRKKQTGALVPSLTTVDFGLTTLGSSSSRSLQLTNGGIAGDSNITITNWNVTGTGYSLVNPPSLPITLTPGGSTTLQLQFAPTGSGTINGQFQVTNNGSNNPLNVSLTGQGNNVLNPIYRVNAGGPTLTASPLNWSTDVELAPSQYVNVNAIGNQTSSTSNTINITHSSIPAGTPMALFQTERWDLPTPAPMIWSFPVTSSGNYQVRLYFAETFSGASAVGSRVFDVSIENQLVLDNYDIFADVGANSGVVKTFIATVTDGTLNIQFGHVTENPSIRAIEISPIASTSSLGSAPTSLSFGNVVVGASSSSQTVTLTNNGGSGAPSIQVSAASLTGTGASQFSITNFTAGTLTPGQSMQFNVIFSPTSTGSKTASVAITHNGSNASPLNISLSGTGTNPSPNAQLQITPASVNFGEVTTGYTSEPVALTLTNTAPAGGSSLTISNVALSGTHAAQFLVTPFSTITLTPGQSTTIGVTFRPSSDGSKTAAIQVTHNGTNASPQNVALTGVGVSVGVGSWSTVSATNSPSVRHENGFVHFNGKFYLIGGRGIKPVNIFDPATGTWTAGANPPIELHHVQAIVYNNLIWVVGAYTGGCCTAEVGVSNIYTYNPTTNTWATGATIPVARRRGSVGVVLYNNKFYLVGGLTGGHGATATSFNFFDEFNPATGIWTTLPNAPRARDHFNAVVIGNNLYAAGGRNTSDPSIFNATIPEVDVYNFSTGTWSTLPAGSNIPTQRGGTTNVVLGNEVVVIGGESGTQSVAHNQVQALNVTTNTWRSLPSLVTGRHGTQATLCNGSIYIAAGSGNQGGSPELGSMEVYTPVGAGVCGGATTAANLAVSATTVNFGSQPVNSTSAPRIIYLTHTGIAGSPNITVSGVTLSGSNGNQFAVNFTTPATLTPGQTVQISLTFTPTSDGAKTASLTIAHNGANTSPVVVSLSGTGGSAPPPSNVLYRVNAGGPVITASPNWSEDSNDVPSVFGNASAATSYASVGSTNINMSNASIPAGTPMQIFQSERWDDAPGTTMQWTFYIPNPGTHTVRLYFAETFATAAGQRVFDVTMENQLVLNDYDIFADVGANAGVVKTFQVSITDGNLNIVFGRVTQNPSIRAIEILAPASNQAPQITNPGNRTSTVGQVINLPISASDPNNNTLTYSATGLPTGLSINANTGIITGTIANGAAAANNVTVTVTDNGVPSLSASANFTWTVNPAGGQSVTSFTLINAATDQPIAAHNPMVSGSTILMSSLATTNLNIRANTNPPTVGSVVFTFSGQPSSRTESGAPYALAGDSAGNYANWNPGLGTFTLTATPYTGPGGAGTAGTPLTITFTFTSGASSNNNPPMVTNPGNQVHDVGTLINLPIVASDPNGNPLTYSATGLPGNLILDENTGVLTGTLQTAMVTTVIVTATDNGTPPLSDSETFTWTVNSPTNSAPVVTNPGGQTSTVNDVVNLQVVASDEDNHTLTYNAVGLPAGLTLNSTSGLITGSPTAASVGVNNVNITVTDNGTPVLSNNVVFSWTVNAPPNQPPTIITPPNQVNNVNDAVNLPISASDPNGNTLTYSATGLPAGLSINTTTGMITGSATPVGTYNVSVTVTDNGSPALSASTSVFTWAINVPVTQAVTGFTLINALTDQPIAGYDPIPNGIVINVGSLPTSSLNIRVNTSPSPVGSVIITFSGQPSTRVESTLPYSLGGDVSGNYSAWNPGLGTFTLGATPYTGAAGAGTVGTPLTITFTLSGGTNTAPTITNPGNQTGTVGNGVNLQIVASDPNGHSLTYSATGLPAGLSINPSTGLISGTLTTAAVSNVSVVVTDNGSPNLTATANLTWTVNAASPPPNQPPVVTSPGNQASTVNDTISLSISASDPDGNALSYSATGLPAGLSINPTTGVITGVVTVAGSTSVTVIVTDNGSPVLSSSVSFQWTVNPPPNQPPTVASPGDQVTAVGASVTLAITASDPNGNTLSYSATGLPAGLVIDPIAGVITGSPTTAGTGSVTVTATDNGVPPLSGSATFNWTVQ